MTDEELMLAICEGDQSAYQTVVKAHLKPISHYAYRMLGNKKDTEDITQETFLKLWINAATWKAEKSKLTTWLHRITHNLCIDYLRKHSRVQTKDNFDDDFDNSDGSNAYLDKSDFENENEKIKVLDRALKQLPENQRSAITLCTIQNFSNKEAAAIMNLSIKALESNIARAKRSLKTIVQATHENDNADSPLTKQKA